MSNLFAGLDWASRTHAACVIDERGAIRVQFEITHDRAGLAELCRKFKAFGVRAVAIERPSGLIVDALMEAGFTVVPIHPNVVKATRPRYRSHGGKSDRRDGYQHHVASFDDGHIMMSFPGAGRICAAQILAELGSVRERFDTVERFTAEAGVAPVTYESGKSKAVAFRWACNHRLRAALTCLADNSRHASAWAANLYAHARARGCDHPHATRILARAWAGVIWRAWQDRKPYDPARHRAAQALLQTT